MVHLAKLLLDLRGELLAVRALVRIGLGFKVRLRLRLRVKLRLRLRVRVRVRVRVRLRLLRQWSRLSGMELG